MDWNYLLLYFIAGIVQDFLATLNWRYVAEKNIPLATIFSFLATVTGFIVLYDIFTRLDAERSLVSISVYALGVGVGTFIAMKFKPGFSKK